MSSSETVFFSDVTANGVTQANALLEYLANQCNADWQKILRPLLGETEYELNVRNVRARLAMWGIEQPVGAVAGGTSSFRSAAGLPQGEDSQRAIRLLKSAGRLVQAGKGRGKALVVLSKEPLSMENLMATTPLVAEAPNLFIPPAMRDALISVQRAAETVERSRQDAHNALQQARERIEELETELEQIKSELESVKHSRATTTW